MGRLEVVGEEEMPMHPEMPLSQLLPSISHLFLPTRYSVSAQSFSQEMTLGTPKAAGQCWCPYTSNSENTSR